MSNPNVNDIVVDDGSKTYSIKNKQGEYLGEFRFRPTDTNIVSRYKEVVDFFVHRILSTTSKNCPQV